MALEWDETCLDVSVSDYDPDSIIQLQALCRGWLVRKKLKDLQTEFQQIVLELDGPTTQVEWTDSALPHPVICRLSKKSRKPQDQMPTRKLSSESKQNSVKKTDRVIESECPKCAELHKTSVESSRTESIERSAQPVASKPDPEKIQSDQEAQTEFMQTNQQRLTSEATHREEDNCQPTVTDRQQPCRDISGDDNRFHIQDSGDDTDSMTVPKNLRAVNKENEHHRITDSDAEGGSGTRGPVPVGSEAVTSSASVRSLVTNVVLSDSVAAVSGPGSESLGMRRVDSFYGDQTSVWDSSSSVVQEQETGAKRLQGQHSDHGTTAASVRDQGGCLEMGTGVEEGGKLRSLSTDDLLKQRQNVAMELLWVQQAIISRKRYLKLKMQMDGAA